MNPRVLVIAYIFPPTGGAGVQRVTKFVKYLPQFGWSPSVLTVANPSVPLFDETLGTDIPMGTIIRRAWTWEPAYSFKVAVASDGERSPESGRRIVPRVKGFLRRLVKLLMQPDPQILWLPQAVREGLQLLSEVPHSTILATAPPFTNFLVGAILSRWTSLPLVLDYRDEWDLTSAYFEQQRPAPTSRAVQQRMQYWAVRTARALIATTRSSAQSLERVRRRAHSRARVTWIYNGYDPDDLVLEPSSQAHRADTYRLVYVGTLWTLTSPAPLVEAVQVLCRSRPDLAGSLELVFAGRRIGPAGQVLERLKGLPCRVVDHSYLNHRDAVHLLQSADGLCVLLSDLPGAGRVVPAKIFEYMAMKRPILSIAPPGELWELLRSYPAASPFVPGDVQGVAAWLAAAIERHQQHAAPEIQDWDASAFDRRTQAGQLAEILNSLQ
jgi:glycosyltransferase involved in cell wall biosynthesis